jgi:hypothetical protein
MIQNACPRYITFWALTGQKLPDIRDDPVPPLGELADEDFIVRRDIEVPRRLFLVGLWRLRWNIHVI